MRSQLLKRKKGSATTSTSSVDAQSTPTTLTMIDDHQRGAMSYEETRDLSILVANIVKDISEATEMLTPLKSTMALIIRGLELARSINENKGAWKDLQDTLAFEGEQVKDWIAEMERNNRKPNSSAIKALESYASTLKPIQEEVEKVLERSKPGLVNTLRRINTARIEQDEISRLTRQIDKSFQRFSMNINIVITRQIADLQVQSLEMHSEMRLQFQSLTTPKQIDYGTTDSFVALSYGRDLDLCEPGTRAHALEEIRRWADDKNSEKQVFWLRDAAGTGKTTVAATMAHEWFTAKQLAARFFFSPNSTATSVIERFCTMLANDLSVQIPSLQPIVANAIRSTPPSHFGFREQFRRLIIEPLRSFQTRLPLIIVIDAIDDCEANERTILLEGILNELPLFRHLKVLLTSRPFPDINAALTSSNLIHGQDVQLLDIRDKAYHDIRIYLNNRLPKLSPEQREMIVSHSQGLFLWAATAYRMLKRSRRPAQLLAQLINGEMSGSFDKLYLSALHQAQADPTTKNLMIGVLQLVIAAFQPISSTIIEALLPNNPCVYDFVQDLGGVLKDGHPEKPIYVIHPTFREFIANKERANGFVLDVPSSHEEFAKGCFVLLAKYDRDILHLHDHGTMIPLNGEIENLAELISRSISPAVAYASSYWAHHVAACSEASSCWKRSVEFISTSLLPWIELMSWRSQLAGCLEGLSKLFYGSRRLTALGHLTSSECLAITDAHRFVIQHQHLIRKSALHAYTALAFSPEDSTLFRTFRVRYKRMVPRVSSNIPIRWSSHQVLPNQRYVQKIEYGLDGSRIVSLGIGGILQVWDTISASMIARADGIAQFICSPDGRYLIFYSYANNRVCIWDLATGSPKFHAFDPSPEKTALIAPHPHNLYVLVVTNGLNTGLRIWDLEHGIPTQPTIPLEAHIHSLAVSPDSTRLVYVSSTAGNPNTATVVLWNLETSEEIGRYTMTSPGNPSCVKFQPNGQRFITCDGEHGGNGSIYLSHRDTGMIVRRFQGHYQAVWDAIFSAKNDFLASHDKYETKIVLWRLSDFDEPGAIKHLEGHTGTVRYISFSPNGEQIASVSLDQTVRVWDVSSGASLQTFFLGFTGNIYLSFISPDWRQFVTVTHDNQLHVYDITAPAEGIMNREDIEKMSVPIVALSPKTSLAAAQTDTRENSFQLWDLVTMSSLETQHEMGPSPVDKVTALSFSAAGGRIAAGSWRGGIQIWTTIGESRIILSLAPHKEAVQRIVFSPDGGFVASLSSKSVNC